MNIDKLKPAGPQQLNFVAEQEPMCIYALEDGTFIKVRLILMNVTANGHLPDGAPKYDCQFQHVMHVTPGPNTKKDDK